MSRIRLGQKNGRMGFWVAAAGYDADQEVAKWLANSDYDQLKLLHHDVVTITGSKAGNYYAYTEQTIATWTDLGFTPLIFLSARGGAYSNHHYPFGGELWSDTAGGSFGMIYWKIYSDHLVVGQATGYNIPWGTIIISYHAFANDLPVAVLS